MKLSDLNEEWTDDDERRMKQWNSRTFNARGHGNNWHVEDRFSLRDKVVAKFDNKEEAWKEADRLQAGENERERDYHSKGGANMTMGAVKLDYKNR